MKIQLVVSVLFVVALALVAAVGYHNNVGPMPTVEKIIVCRGLAMELPMPISRWWDVVILPLVAFAIILQVVMTWRRLHMGARDQVGDFSCVAWVSFVFGFVATIMISPDAGCDGLSAGIIVSALGNANVIWYVVCAVWTTLVVR
jgi:hypothetical protein